MRRILSILAVLIGVTPNLATAQPPPMPRVGWPEPTPTPAGVPAPTPGLTLADLESRAERCNPTLAQASARVRAARGRQLQAGLYPNPVIGYQGGEIGNDGRAGQQGGFVGQEIVTAGKQRLSQAVAGQEIRQAECDWAAQRFRVLTDVRRGFFDVLVAQRTMELAQQLLDISKRGVTAADQLFRAKEAARTDLLQARIESDSAEIFLERARNRHTAAWRNLAAVVGDPSLQPAPLSGGLREEAAPLTWEGVLNRLMAESPQLAGAEAGVARARAALSRECAGRIPNVELQAGVQYDNATRSTISGVQFSVPLPIHNRNQGNIARAQAELSAAHHEVRRVRLALEQRLAAVFERYATARQQVEKYDRAILPNAEESLRLVSEGYRQGEFGYLVLLTAQRTYFQTHVAHLDALRDLREASAILEGNLLSDSLQGVPGESLGER